MTIARGKIVMDGGKVLANAGDGQFLARDISPYAEKAA
jgi:hypothetical protein